MAALGSRGGRIGGPARARVLPAARRAAIARKAARARWSRPVLSGGAPLDLASLVAHGGSAVARFPLPGRLEREVIRALKASRRNSALARMLPVFLWRTRDRLDMTELRTLARKQRQAAPLGFFLEASAKLGGTRRFDAALRLLRSDARRTRPSYFFSGSANRPYERLAADRATPALARRWGMLMNMPWESFASYFEKTASL